MPSGRLHAVLTERVLGSTDGREVQKILDSTARAHGPSHRQDHVHSLPGVAAELALRGQLTLENMAAASLHLMADDAWSRMWSSVPMPSRFKQPMKAYAEELLADSLQPTRRRRRR